MFFVFTVLFNDIIEKQVNFTLFSMGLFEGLVIEKIIADGDLDGLIAASILKTYFINAKTTFSHPAEIRSGNLDEIIDINTAICDLHFIQNAVYI